MDEIVEKLMLSVPNNELNELLEMLAKHVGENKYYQLDIPIYINSQLECIRLIEFYSVPEPEFLTWLKLRWNLQVKV